MVYFLAMAAVCCGVAVLGRNAAMALFNIDPALQADARLLILIIAASISARLVFSPVTAALEAFQRFDLINRAYLANLTVRAVGSVALLLAGYGLVALGWLVLAVGLAEDLWNLVNLKRVFPQLRFTVRAVRRDAFGDMIDYGKHSSVMTVANMVELQAPATILGLVRGPAEVAFFALPWRVLMYTTEAFAKVGQITASVTAELDAQRDARRIWTMAVTTNRMCVVLFMPLAIFLTIFATPLLTVWVSPEVGQHSGPLLPILVVPFLFAIAGQFNSGSVLLGQARHRVYAWSIVVEVIAMVAGLFLLAPRYGAYGVACVVSVALTAVRGAFLAVLMCRVNGFALGQYLRAIYLRALLAAIPAAAAGLMLRLTLLPGRGWLELLAAASVVAGIYFSLAFFTVLDADSRGHIVARLPGSHRLFSRFA
jgi:O-antigen/teichoic acid export membrane protein